MDNKLVLSSLAMDLKRVALGLHRGSEAMAVRFEQEAKSRLAEVELNSLLPYMKDTLIKINMTFAITDRGKKAEDILMYSTIVQNYVLYK
jgi:hypothetical protein